MHACKYMHACNVRRRILEPASDKLLTSTGLVPRRPHGKLSADALQKGPGSVGPAGGWQVVREQGRFLHRHICEYI